MSRWLGVRMSRAVCFRRVPFGGWLAVWSVVVGRTSHIVRFRTVSLGGGSRQRVR